MRDEALEAWLIERLSGVDLAGFEAPTEPAVRVATDIRDVLRPSRMAGCERMLALMAGSLPLTAEWSVKSLTAVNFGTHVHKRIQAVLPGHHEIKVEGPWLRGSLDTAGHTTVIDYKTIDKKGAGAVKKAGKPRDDHWAQVTWYARHHGKPRASVVYVPKTAETEADLTKLMAFTGDVPDLPHEFDLKAHRILAHIEAETLPAYEPQLACRWCPVRAACGKARPVEMEFHTKLVGQTFREGLDLAAIGLEEGQELTLIWEPENQYGSRITEDQGAAVKVMAGDRQLGYVPDEGSGVPTAQIIARHFKAGGKVKAVITNLTGGVEGRENRGVNLLILCSD